MKNHKEMFEALFAGETLVCKSNPNRKIAFEGNHLSLFGFNDYNLALITYADWEIKPKTININGFEVPKPVKNQLVRDAEYYIPDLLEDSLYETYTWQDDSIDYQSLERGIVHLTSEAAITHAKALLSFSLKEKLND